MPPSMPPAPPLRVEVACSDRDLAVAIIDQGQGFDPARPSTTGLGLAGLRERVDSLGGEFSLESSPGGTRLSMRLIFAEGGVQ